MDITESILGYESSLFSDYVAAVMRSDRTLCDISDALSIDSLLKDERKGLGYLLDTLNGDSEAKQRYIDLADSGRGESAKRRIAEEELSFFRSVIDAGLPDYRDSLYKVYPTKELFLEARQPVIDAKNELVMSHKVGFPSGIASIMEHLGFIFNEGYEAYRASHLYSER